MGWERKRGKLHELNQLLARLRAHNIHSGGGPCTGTNPGVRYVITLDADTRVPRGAAARLVGTMAHPLNRPKVQRARQAASSKDTPWFSHASRRRFRPIAKARCSREFFPARAGWTLTPPLFPTSTRICFEEGTYTGKGIYDIDAFEEALAGKVQENTLLSHDLVRRHLRARRSGHRTSNCSKSFPRTTGSRPRGSIAGRAATGNSCLDFWEEAGCIESKSAQIHHSRDQPLENAGQPAPHTVGARHVSDCWSWVG